MRELPIIDDKRLLGALDYIDERFIAEVTEDYEIFDTAPGAKLPPRARMYRFRQFAAAAACLLLLSFASLGVNHVANAVISFAASSGGSLNEYGSQYDRAIDSYPQGMSAKEIYDDVLKGGWVVNTDGEIVGGENLWQDFLAKTENKNDATVLIAGYSEELEQIALYSLSYNGEVYTVDTRYIRQLENKDLTYSDTKKYLVCHDLTEPGYDWFTPPPKYVWFLTDYPEIHFIEQLIPNVSEDKYEFLCDNYPLWNALIFLNDQ